MNQPITKLLQNKLLEKSKEKNYEWLNEARYLSMLECVVFEDKIYFPEFEYESVNKEPYNLILEHYGAPSYCPVSLILKEIELPYPVADKQDKVICRCLCDKFHFSYGSYELYVKCSFCGNEWSAY